METRIAGGLTIAFLLTGVLMSGTAHADPPSDGPPGQSVENFGQCVKAGLYRGATPDPQSDPGGTGPITTNNNEKLRGPLFASFKGEFPFDSKTPFEGVNGCAM